MTYQLALGAAASFVMLVSGVSAIRHAALGKAVDEPYLAKLFLLGLLGGAALTPLIDHLGG